MAGLYVVLGLVIGWFIEFMRSYMSKKGENLATHEDINRLVDQVKAVTIATKEIENKISSDLWDRQKQWELKRDVLFEAGKRMVDVDAKLLSLNTFWSAKVKKEIEDEGSRIRLQHQYITEWQASFRAFEETQTLILITCSIETIKAFAELQDEIRNTARKIIEDDLVVYSQLQKSRDRKFGMARVAIRHELGLTFSIMPLSSGSSAAPSPGSRAPE